MKFHLLFSVVFLLSAVLLAGACTRLGLSQGAQSPKSYLTTVLDILQTRSIRTAVLDWKAIRAKSFALASDAKDLKDTYPAISFAIGQLGDHHSFLLARNGTVIGPKQTESPKPEHHIRVESADTLQSDDHLVGFLVVGTCGSGNETSAAHEYSKTLQQKISRIAQTNPCGWIVDLRGNTGGNMWPMIVGTGPLIGAGTLGYFQYSNIAIPWFYENGQTGVTNGLGKQANFKLDPTISDCAKDVPIAVLIDGETASSGEATTVSFKGRPNTRFFGQHTRGLSTSNEQFPLPDGAVLYLTTSIDADRNHVLYNTGIEPDVEVKQGSISLGDKADPVVKAALEWLVHSVTQPVRAVSHGSP